MVENKVLLVGVPYSVGTVVHILLLSASYANEAYDVVVAWAHGPVAQSYARVGCCLSLDGGVVADGEVALQFNNSRHIEDHNLLAAAAYCCSERAGTAVVEVCHMYDCSPASSSNVTSETFCSRECRCLCQRNGRAQHSGK